MAMLNNQMVYGFIGAVYIYIYISSYILHRIYKPTNITWSPNQNLCPTRLLIRGKKQLQGGALQCKVQVDWN